VIRAKTIIEQNCNPAVHQLDPSDGIWAPILQCLVYDYINDNSNIHDINHDILGFIDKDVEAWYGTKRLKRDTRGKLIRNPITNEPIVETVTIANIDIYED
jgi:hypothetical protein